MAQEFFTGASGVVLLREDQKSLTGVDIEYLFSTDSRLTGSQQKGCVFGYLMTGITYGDEDIVVPVTAVDDTRVLYTSGQNFGQFSLEGIAFVSNKKQVLKELSDAFSQARASASPQPATVTGLGMPNTKVFVTKMNFFGADPTTQSVRFSIECVVAPVTNKR